MEYQQQAKLRKFLIIATAVLFVGLIIFGIITAINNYGKQRVSVKVLPEDATVTIDGKEGSGGTIYVKEGRHTFTATKDGFTADSQVVNISKDITTVVLLPDPSSDEANAWANQEEVRQQREEYGAQKAEIRGTSIRQEYPLIDQLPRYDIANVYTLDYGFKGKDNSEIYYIIKDSTPNGRINALKWIRSMNIDPTTLDIRFEGYTNPLTKETE